MKRFLISLIACVCVSIGAWADVTITNNRSLNTNDYVSPAIRIETTTAGDISSASLTDQSSWATMIFVSGPVNEADITALNTAYGSYAKIINLTQTTGLDASWLSQLSGSAIEAIGLPDGYTLEVSNENIKVVYSSAFSGIKNSAYEDKGDDEIDVYVQKSGGIATLNLLQSNNYLLQYRTINLSGASNTIDTSSSEYTTLSGYYGITINRVVAPSNDPYTVDGCNVSINLAKAEEGQTLADLIDLAKAEVIEGGKTNICTLTVSGELSSDDIQALGSNNMDGATRIDLSGATLASGVNINSLNIPSSLTSLVLPKGQTVSSGLATKLDDTNLIYAYSPTSSDQDASQAVADYVWVNEAGGMHQALVDEAMLKTSHYIKVASSEVLNSSDLDYSTLPAKGTIDLSEAVLPSDVLAAKIKVSGANNTQANNIILPSSFDYDALDGFGNGGGSKGPAGGFVGLICSKDGTTLNAYSPESREDQDLASLLTGVTTLNIGGKLTDGFVTAINGANSLENLSVHSLATLPTNNILTLTNTNLKGVSLNGLSSSSLKLNVDACSALQTVDLTSANINSVSAQNITTLTNVYANPVTLATKNTSTGEGCINVTGSLNDGMKISVDKDFDMERIIPTLTEKQVADHVNQAGAEMKDNDGCSITLSEDGKTAIVHTNEAGHFATLIAKYQASFATGVTFKFDATSKVNADDLFALSAYYKDLDNKYFVDLFDIPVTAEMYEDGNGNSVNIEQVIGWRDEVTGTYTEGSLVDKLQSANKALRGILLPNNPEHVGTTIIKDADGVSSPQATATFNKFVAYSYIDMTTEKQVTTAHVYDPYKGKAACENNFNDLKTLLGNHSEIAETDLYLISTNSQSMIDISSLGTGVSRVEIYDNEMVKGSTRASITVYPKENTDGALKLAVDITGVENTPAERLTVIGAMSSDDFTALSSFTDGPRVLDLREATGFTAEMVASITNSNIEYILLPKDWEKNDVKTAASASGLSGLKAAISISSDAKELVGYLKQAGSLAEARCLWEGGSAAIGATVTVTKDGETQTYKTFTPTTTATLEKVTLSGSLNASDLGRSVTDPHKINIENGHLCSDATFNVSGLANAKATDNGYGTANGVTAGSSALNGETIKTLDLRDAVFENQYDMNFNMLGYSSCLENVSLPISEDMTILPLGTLMGGSGSKIDYLCIPSNFKTIGRYALGNTTIRCVTTDNAEHTVVIGANGEVYATDADAKVGSWDTFTLSSSLTSIGCGSFTPQSETITDVYVMATTTPKCEKDAFSSGMLYAWGGFDGAGAYCRDKYINGGKVATVLHFPEKGSMTDTQYETMKKNYTDINKVYTKKDQTGALDGNGNLMAWPSLNEIYRVYNQASLGLTWNDWPVNYNPEVNTTGNCDDFSASLVGSNNVTAEASGDIAPTKVGDYSFDDYIGWHQFVLSMATAYGPEVEIEIKDEKIVYRYVEDNWYTFCIPFDMTEKEVIELLGVPASIDDKIDNMVGEERITSDKMPKIHTLKEVTRVKNGSMGTITLSTTVDLAIKDKDDNYTYYNPSTTNYEANTANSADKRGEKIVIRGGYPYLIKPYRKTTDKFSNLGQHVLTSYEFPKEASSVYRDGCHIVGAVKAEGADVSQLDQTTVVFATPYTGHEVQAAFTDVKNPNAAGPAKYKDGNETKDYKYRFMGQYWHQDLPLYSYYITGGKWYYYKTKKNGYYWKPYNCIINISSVLDETATTYYKIVGVDSKYAAKLEGDLYMKYTNGHNDDFVENENKTEARSIRIIFDDAIEEYDSEGNEVTAIESLDGQMLAPVSGKVYNMKGQYVGTGVDGLQKGIYIVNGKKIVVD